MKTPLVFTLGIVLAATVVPANAALPVIQASATLQHQAITLGQSASFAVAATGTAPLSYQWHLDGRPLPGRTNSALGFASAQPGDEGDYSVVVTNREGMAASPPARLWVVPPSSDLTRANFTNSAGVRVPYAYLMPTNHHLAERLPLVCYYIGVPDFYGYEDQVGLWADQTLHCYKVFASYRQQVENPAVFVWLTRRTGEGSWQPAYVAQVQELVDHLITQFNIDTNRVYAVGGYDAVPVIKSSIVLRPGRFAGAIFCSAHNTSGDLAAEIKHVPIWSLHSAADTVATVTASRQLVQALRQVGANPIYTEFATGPHLESIMLEFCMPPAIDWLLAQRRGAASSAEPILSITSPTTEPTYASSVTPLPVAGSAEALGQNISQVAWENITTGGTGVASGSNLWSVAGLLLVPPATNSIRVTATTTSWAPAFGGNTTFSDTLAVSWDLHQPVIAAQPTNQTVRSGATASFTVVAYSPLPLSYQWQFNAAPIIGATNATLTLTNVQAVHAGTYAVVVADQNASVTSAPAALTILFDPIIVQQPCSVTVPQGGSVTLSVAVTNNATLPIGYRWKRGSMNFTHALVNEYVDFLTLTNCQATTNYEVIITNLARTTIRSSNVVVTVLPDLDGDGLPDAWEIDCGLCQTSTNHARADDDADGRSNLQEYQAGTDPTNALSYLKVEDIAPADGGTAVVLRFVAVSNQTYSVRYRDLVHTGEWTRLADVPAAPTNRMVELRDPAVPNGPQRFYRLFTPGTPSP